MNIEHMVLAIIEYFGAAWFAVTATADQFSVSQFLKQYLSGFIDQIWVTIFTDMFSLPTRELKKIKQKVGLAIIGVVAPVENPKN